MRQTGKGCRLANAHVVRRGVEVDRARATHADRPLPQIHAVEILVENLLLVQMACDA